MTYFFRKSIINNALMLTLAIISIFLLLLDSLFTDVGFDHEMIQAIDITIACIFLAEFLYHIMHAKDKKMFLRHRWWELLAAIPLTTHTTMALRSIKLVRLIPLLESLRIIRFAVRLRLLLELSQRYTKHRYLIYIATLVCGVTLLGAFGFHYFEFGVNPNVKTFFDSIWWAIVTTTTIGYGDIYPITVGGRLIAIILIFFGIGILGAFIAAVDSYILTRNRKTLLGSSLPEPVQKIINRNVSPRH